MSGTAGHRRDALINVVELRRRLGNRRQVPVELISPGWAVDTTRVPEGEAVRVDLVLESVQGGVTAKGSVRAPWTGNCRRCLDEVHGHLDAEVSELFEEQPTEGETYPIDSDVVDLWPLVSDVILLELPLAPLCRTDCPGPAPDRFSVSVADDSAPPAPDPRWAALDELRRESGAGEGGTDSDSDPATG